MGRQSKDIKLINLSKLDIFSGLSTRELDVVAQVADTVTLPAGTVLCRQDDSARELIVLSSGEAEVIVDGAPLTLVGPGEVVGEMALLGTGRRNATVVITKPSTAYVIDSRNFGPLLQRIPTLQARLMATVSARARNRA